MRIHRRYALAATAWLVVVVVGAVLVWAVISRAGQDVIGQSTPPIDQVAPFTSPPRSDSDSQPRNEKPKPKPKPTSKPSRPGSGSPGASPSAGPSGPGSSSGTASPGPDPSPPASTGAGPRPGPGPGPGPSSPNNPPPASSPPPSPVQQGVRRSWQGSEGVVTVECRRTRIELKGAQPNSGWSIEIDDRGPDEVQVDFDSNDGDRRTRVESVCVGGTPRFEVDREDD